MKSKVEVTVVVEVNLVPLAEYLTEYMGAVPNIEPTIEGITIAATLLNKKDEDYMLPHYVMELGKLGFLPPSRGERGWKKRKRP
uniref:Uncharacterized protein n=1 Tax=viral metagenome TaxID=1070528 RepID=A0A6M3L473_9ZZZZ